MKQINIYFADLSSFKAQKEDELSDILKKIQQVQQDIADLQAADEPTVEKEDELAELEDDQSRTQAVIGYLGDAAQEVSQQNGIEQIVAAVENISPLVLPEEGEFEGETYTVVSVNQDALLFTFGQIAAKEMNEVQVEEAGKSTKEGESAASSIEDDAASQLATLTASKTEAATIAAESKDSVEQKITTSSNSIVDGIFTDQDNPNPSEGLNTALNALSFNEEVRDQVKETFGINMETFTAQSDKINAEIRDLVTDYGNVVGLDKEVADSLADQKDSIIAITTDLDDGKNSKKENIISELDTTKDLIETKTDTTDYSFTKTDLEFQEAENNLREQLADEQMTLSDFNTQFAALKAEYTPTESLKAVLENMEAPSLSPEFISAGTEFTEARDQASLTLQLANEVVSSGEGFESSNNTSLKEKNEEKTKLEDDKDEETAEHNQNIAKIEKEIQEATAALETSQTAFDAAEGDDKFPLADQLMEDKKDLLEANLSKTLELKKFAITSAFFDIKIANVASEISDLTSIQTSITTSLTELAASVNSLEGITQFFDEALAEIETLITATEALVNDYNGHVGFTTAVKNALDRIEGPYNVDFTAPRAMFPA